MMDDRLDQDVTAAGPQPGGGGAEAALGTMMMAVAQAMADAAHNAANGQQQAFVTAQAATTMGVTTLYALDIAGRGVAAHSILGS